MRPIEEKFRLWFRRYRSSIAWIIVILGMAICAHK